jgi:GNAT superfamily N-acetyltransferase
MTHERAFGDWLISDDPARFELERGHDWISRQSYWAAGIPLATFRRAVQNSLVIGAYDPAGRMGAMARVVTDHATFAWLNDVFVDDAHRGHGLGIALAGFVLDHPELQGLRQFLLATRDAHGLYARFGFAPLAEPGRWMIIHDPDVYRPPRIE